MLFRKTKAKQAVRTIRFARKVTATRVGWAKCAVSGCWPLGINGLTSPVSYRCEIFLEWERGQAYDSSVARAFAAEV
jgi:hypothetical protein